MLGRLSQSVEAHDEAITIGKELQELLDDDDYGWLGRYGNQLATIYSNKGVCLLSLGQLVETITVFESAIAIRERLRIFLLRDGVEGDWLPEYRSDLATSYSHKGLTLAEQGRMAEAEDTQDKAISIGEGLRELLLRGGDDRAWRQEYRHGLLNSYTNKVSVLEMQGKYVEAVEASDRAITIGEGLREILQRSGGKIEMMEILNHLANSHGNKGRALHGQKKLTKAVQAYDQAIAIGVELRKRLLRDGDDGAWLLQYGDDLSSVYLNKGTVLFDQGRMAEAVTAADEAINIRKRVRELMLKDGNDAAWPPQKRYHLSSAYSNRGNILHVLGMQAAAIVAFKEAITIGIGLRDFLLREGGEVAWTPQYRHMLALIYGNYSFSLLLQGRIIDAFSAATKALDINRALMAWLAEKGMLPAPNWQDTLARICCQMANIEAKKGNFPTVAHLLTARGPEEGALPILQRLESKGWFAGREIREKSFRLAMKVLHHYQPTALPGLVREHLAPAIAGSAPDSFVMLADGEEALLRRLDQLQKSSDENSAEIVEIKEVLAILHTNIIYYFAGTAASCNHYACALEKQGKMEEAEKILRDFSGTRPTSVAAVINIFFFLDRQYNLPVTNYKEEERIEQLNQAGQRLMTSWPTYDEQERIHACKQLAKIANLGLYCIIRPWPTPGNTTEQNEFTNRFAESKAWWDHFSNAIHTCCQGQKPWWGKLSGSSASTICQDLPPEVSDALQTAWNKLSAIKACLQEEHDEANKTAGLAEQETVLRQREEEHEQEIHSLIMFADQGLRKAGFPETAQVMADTWRELHAHYATIKEDVSEEAKSAIREKIVQRLAAAAAQTAATLNHEEMARGKKLMQERWFRPEKYALLGEEEREHLAYGLCCLAGDSTQRSYAPMVFANAVEGALIRRFYQPCKTKVQSGGHEIKSLPKDATDWDDATINYLNSQTYKPTLTPLVSVFGYTIFKEELEEKYRHLVKNETLYAFLQEFAKEIGDPAPLFNEQKWQWPPINGEKRFQLLKVIVRNRNAVAHFFTNTGTPDPEAALQAVLADKEDAFFQYFPAAFQKNN